MGAEVTHVIKKNHIAARTARRPEPSLLYSTLKVPKEHVRLKSDGNDAEASYRLNRLLQHEQISVGPAPVEVTAQESVKPPPPPTAGRGEAEVEDEPTIEDVEAEWRARLEKEVEKARTAALQEGKAQAMAAVQDELDHALQALAGDAAALQEAWKEHIKESRLHLVQLAFRVSRTILDAPLPEGIRTVSETAIADAVDRMADEVAVDVVLHPVSYLRLQESGLEEQLNAVKSRLRWRSNPDLKENEWIVESDRSAIRRLEAELLDQLQRELSLRDTHYDEHPDDPS